MRIKISISFLFIFFCLTAESELFAQLTLELSEHKLISEQSSMYTKNMYEKDMYAKQEFPSLSSILLAKQKPVSTVTFEKDYVVNCYGFFCKQEVKRDKKTSLPVRMRLGTLQDVNNKEYGKN